MQCPACAAQGKDRKKNNLAVYDDDGHKWCFACGYYEPGDPMKKIQKLKDKLHQIDEHIAANSNDLKWPDDYSTTLPSYASAWLATFGITNEEIDKYRIGFSLKQELLIIPVFDKDGNLIMWTGRNFKINYLTKYQGPKYVTYGKKADIVHIMGKESKDLIIVEDFISAIKVGRKYQTTPLFGSTMSTETLRMLSERFKSVGVWLDADKRVEAVKQALRASQFIPAYAIYSKDDPKFYNDAEINFRILEAQRDVVFPDTGVAYEKSDELGPKKQNNTDRTILWNAIEKRYEHYGEWTKRLDLMSDKADNRTAYETNFWSAVIRDENELFLPKEGEKIDDWMRRTGCGDRVWWHRSQRLSGRKLIRVEDGEFVWVRPESPVYRQKVANINPNIIEVKK